MKLLNKTAYVKCGSVLPGYVMARIIAEYSNSWYLLKLEGTTQSTFLMPEVELRQCYIGDDADFQIVDATPEVLKMMEKARQARQGRDN